MSELRNINGNVYTDEKIYNLIDKYKAYSGRAIINAVSVDIKMFLQNFGLIRDDITYFIAEFNIVEKKLHK